MASGGTKQTAKEYLVPSGGTQEPQPSPLAMLAATCSKIGQGEGGQGMKVQPQLVQIDPNDPQQQAWLAGGTQVIDATTGKAITLATLPMQQQVMQPANTGLAYNSLQPTNIAQTITLPDGQEAMVIPISNCQPQQMSAVPALMASNGQLIRAQVPQFQAAQPINVGQFGGNVINLGSVSGAGVQNVQLRQVGGMVSVPMGQQQQTVPVQVPMAGPNGQTIMQTVNLPVQALQGVQVAQGPQIIQQAVQSVQNMEGNVVNIVPEGSMAQGTPIKADPITIVSHSQADVKPTLASPNSTKKLPPNVVAFTNSPTILTVPSVQTVPGSASVTQSSATTVTVGSLPGSIVSPSSSMPAAAQALANGQIVLPTGQVLQNINGQTVATNIQLAGQSTGQIFPSGTVIPTINLSNIQQPQQQRPQPGIQTIQVQNLSQLGNMATAPTQQLMTPGGQIINGTILGSTALLGSQAQTIHTAPQVIQVQGQGAQIVAQIPQEESQVPETTKWQIIPGTTQITAVESEAPQPPPEGSTPGRLRRVACTCPNCKDENGRNKENKKKVHVCHMENCGKEYGKTSHLRAHLRWHNGERPFICNWMFCGKRFTRSDELQRHKRTHTGDKKFACGECGKKFMRSDHLSKHIKIHAKRANIQPDSSTVQEDESIEDEDITIVTETEANGMEMDDSSIVIVKKQL